VNKFPLRRIGVRTLVAACMSVAGFAGILVGVSGGAAGADPATQNIALNNATAEKGTDCPDTLNDYWHFVIAPNNSFEFVAIHLNISGLGVVNFSGGQIIPNGGQHDNVFIAVPAGKSLTDLIKAGSSADVTPAAPEPNKFNLSHTCDGNSTTTSSEVTTTSEETTTSEATTTSSEVTTTSEETTTSEATTTSAATTTSEATTTSAATTTSSAASTSSSTNEVAPPVPSSSTASSVAAASPTTPTTAAASVQVQAPAVPDDGLPNTGTDTSGFAWAGALLLVFGGTSLFLSRRPRRS